MLLSLATPFESSLSPPCILFYAFPPFFLSSSKKCKSIYIYRYGRARGRSNSFRRNEVMKSDLTSLTGLIGLIWRSLYVDKLQGCVHWDAHQLCLACLCTDAAIYRSECSLKTDSSLFVFSCRVYSYASRTMRISFSR